MNDKLIIAIDTADERQAIKMIEAMDPFTDTYKLGHILYSSTYFWAVVKYIRAMGKDIFLDLKLWDIPKTVENTILNLTENCDFKYITVRYDALTPLHIDKLKSFTNPVAVVHLSSNGDYDEAARQWAELCPDEFTHGGYEYAVVSPQCLDFFLPDSLKKIVPGIRPDTDEIGNDDHAYTMTANEAFERGAHQVVIGSAIWKAKDPLKQASRIWQGVNNVS